MQNTVDETTPTRKFKPSHLRRFIFYYETGGKCGIIVSERRVVFMSIFLSKKLKKCRISAGFTPPLFVSGGCAVWDGVLFVV